MVDRQQTFGCRRWTASLWLPALAVLFVLMRTVGLAQYPHHHPDEGFWASGARNYVQSGDPLLDGRLHPFLSPATFLALSGYFSAVGPSLVSARLFSAGTGLLSCVLMGLLGRRFFPNRPWLPLLLFGVSSWVVLAHRIMLLEAHQTFWLLLAAVFWLSPGGAPLLSGVAYGVALLVKSNSLFLLPAFFLSLPHGAAEAEAAGRSRYLRVPGLFLLSCLFVGGGGYVIARAINPTAFAAAFRFELDGRHFLDEGILFHVGRFGIHPQRALSAARLLLLNAPLLGALALIGLIQILQRSRSTSRADRLFAAWALTGLTFHFAQIYVEYRYFTTLAPAFIFLAAYVLNGMLDNPRLAWGGWWRRTAMVILLLFCVCHSARLVGGLRRHPNEPYWQTVGWVTEHVRREANVLTSPSLGLSLSQRTYDFYRLIYSYQPDAPSTALATVVDRYAISIIIIDPEWYVYENPDMASFIATRCSRLTTIGPFEVLAIREHDFKGWATLER